MMKKRILSGMRPTGKLHLGHYTGALENWVKMQDEYENFHLVADYHVLTTKLDTSDIYNDSIEMVIDWLAVGLDPKKVKIFRQSQIKEHTELFLILAMLITTSRLERNPSLKEQVRDLNIQHVVYGHLGYPVLQAADILIYKGELVPVGEDQVPHVEITREIARKFNSHFGDVFPEPEPLLTVFARLAGLDGKAKMSKSLGNAILLSDEPEIVKQKMRKAVTDPLKIHKNDPGRPEVCVVYSYHQKFNTEESDQIAADCRSGKLGCVECKLRASAKISAFLEPIIEKRKKYEADISLVLDVIDKGERAARKVAVETMTEVRTNMKIG
ncbi:MAG: tryptophan--tRNA ligase [Ignavibacteriales bacterium]|nr:MAG: tryptophan--tRNA ligase [Ignavibacteriaceae bacterium]MBW7872353.1 tryptophan--tRNA ligase [Ignavibacteria bacterium]MCZ2142636.1 tryptophan--tRNA ligase [Ignavibacteriales bacterium]OQY71640.1 MAG: tryptophan--tRNA ligase [Ignavibacteriales bacterium UTCHB3]MBV6445500.1 Tryptophan--tRNA ligase [Ignavibacteriaceae bacterium]